MKKGSIFLGTVATILIIPQLVFAAWWNPLSWFNNWAFSRPAQTAQSPETQVLENRIKELEKKLEGVATSSSLTETPTTTKSQSTQSTKPATTPITKNQTPVVQPIQNYSTILAGAYNNYADREKNLADFADTMFSAVSAEMEGFVSLKSKASAMCNGMESNGRSCPQWTEALIQEYGNDIEVIGINKTFFGNMAKDIRQGEADIRNLANDTLGRIVTKEYAISEIEKMNNSQMLNNTRDALLKVSNEVQVDYKERKAKYEEAFAYIDGLLIGSRPDTSTYVPRPVPAPMPTFPIPPRINTTNTYCSVYGDNISCESYGH